jgi:threonine-phosphate decarboxylase
LLQELKPKAMSIPSPISNRYKEIFNKHNVKVNPFPLDGENSFSLDIAKFIQDVESADMVILPHPHDITGGIIPSEDLGELIERADKLDKTFIIDEAYVEFTELVSPVKHVVESRNFLILRTFSVFYALAGLRIGYGIGPAKLIQNISDAFITHEIDAIAPSAALASLRDAGYRRRTLQFLREEKAYVMGKLTNVRGIKVFDTPCNFLLLNIEKECSDLKDMFLKNNMLIDEFIDDRKRRYIKMPLKKHKFNARFIKTLKRIVEVS